MLFSPRPKAPKSLKRAVSNGTPSWRRELAAFVDGGGSQHAPINGGGDTLLLLACRYGQSSVASLLAADADIEYANKVGHRALHEAVLSGDVATVAAVLAADADVDSQKLAGWTPLHLACTKRTPEAVAVVAQLLVHKAQPTLKNKDGWNACMLAARAGAPEMMRLLLAADPRCCNDPSNTGRTPLITAARHNNVEVLKLLLDAGSMGLDHQDSCGLTALHSAVVGASVAGVEALLAAGAAPGMTDNLNRGVLHMAASAGGEDQEIFRSTISDADAILTRFLSLPGAAGANTVDGAGLTPLHHAAITNRPSAAAILIDYGANVELEDDKGRSAMVYACDFKRASIVALLSEARTAGPKPD